MIKAYIRIIDEHPAVISHLQTSPTTAIELYQRSDTTISSDTIPVDNPPVFNIDTTSLSSTNANKDAVEESDINEHVVKEPDVNKPDYKDDRKDRTNSWGTCAFKWLENLVAQARNAKWLWKNRKRYNFELKVLDSLTPSDMIITWEEQSQLKPLLTPDTMFDGILALLMLKSVDMEMHFQEA